MHSMTVLKNPYPGLRPFEAGDAEYFFGRDHQVDELLLRLSNHRFVAVVGLSGSGKSSLVRAGLIPALKAGHLTMAGSRWHVGICRPGSKPLAALATALDEALGAKPNRLASLTRNSNVLLLDTRVGRGSNEGLLLVVDQFEELFRVSNLREAEHFVDLLLATQHDLSPQFRVYVVLTMRTDRLGECARFEGLPEALNRSQYLVPKLTNDQLREAIEGPAALTETKISPELVQKLVIEAAQGGDQLPLLQHLLMTLWEGRETGRDGTSAISLAQYEAVGSSSNALNDQADRVLATLPKEQQYIASVIFRALTEADNSGDQRRPQRLSELSAVAGAAKSAIVQGTVEHFYDATFLTSPDRGHSADWQVDITHESLIRQWKKLAAWVAEEVKDADDYHYFANRARRGADLLKGIELDLGVEWLKKGHNVAWAARYGGDFSATVQYIRRSKEIGTNAEQEAMAKLAENMLRNELNQAAEIQQSFLPNQAPEIPGYELAGLVVPCRTIGGDYYDFLSYQDGRLGIIIGDVSGKGLPAALVMSSVQGRVQMLCETGPDPASAIKVLNRSFTAREHALGRFVTLFYALLNPVTGALEYSNAGHNCPLILRASGEVEQLSIGGLAMGLFPSAEYKAKETVLMPGDIVVLYTDGVTDAVTPAGDEYGERGLAECLAAHRGQSCKEMIRALMESVRKWCKDVAFADDFTIVLVRRN